LNHLSGNNRRRFPRGQVDAGEVSLDVHGTEKSDWTRPRGTPPAAPPPSGAHPRIALVFFLSCVRLTSYVCAYLCPCCLSVFGLLLSSTIS
jgi:hypothetical protein